MVMTREEVFRATGPTSGAQVRVKIGAKKDGTHRRRRGRAQVPGGRVRRLAGAAGLHVRLRALRPGEREGGRLRRGDRTGRRSRAYRAPGGPISEFAVESVIDEIAGKIGMDPIELRLKNAAKQGTKAAYGPKFGPIGMVETLEAAKAHAHWRTPLQKNQGRGVASRLLVQHRRRDLGVALPQRGRHAVADRRHARHRRLARLAVHDGGRGARRPDRQDPRADRRHRPLGYNFLTGGSRATFSSGMATWRPRARS